MLFLGSAVSSAYFIPAGIIGTAFVAFELYPMLVQRYNYLRMKRLGIWSD